MINLRCGGALIQLEKCIQDFGEKPCQRINGSLGGPALGPLDVYPGNPSATSCPKWIAFGFGGNNRVKTLVPDLWTTVVTKCNDRSLRVQHNTRPRRS